MALPVEARVARLEQMIKHLQSDISEIKAHIRRLDEKIDRSKERSTSKIGAIWSNR